MIDTVKHGLHVTVRLTVDLIISEMLKTLWETCFIIQIYCTTVYEQNVWTPFGTFGIVYI